LLIPAVLAETSSLLVPNVDTRDRYKTVFVLLGYKTRFVFLFEAC
jgi:hypothetical protein